MLCYHQCKQDNVSKNVSTDYLTCIAVEVAEVQIVPQALGVRLVL